MVYYDVIGLVTNKITFEWITVGSVIKMFAVSIRLLLK